MKTIIVDKPGLTKENLTNKLEELRKDYADQMHEYDIKLENIRDGFKFNAEKKVLLINFWVNGTIIADDGKYTIEYETNAPKRYVDQAVNIIKDALEKA